MARSIASFADQAAPGRAAGARETLPGPERDETWARTQVVRAWTGHLCLVDTDGALLAQADSVTQLVDAVDLGVVDSQDAHCAITCAIVALFQRPDRRRCDCRNLPAPST